MKNIHLLPTDKPSRLYKDGEKLKLDIESYGVNNQNIYITSDEDIKDEDYCVHTNQSSIIKICEGEGKLMKGHLYLKKIILTTDQDLIADGVQAIDNEFLEWFVKNPSFEGVEIEDFPTIEKYNSKGEYIHNSNWIYKIIIPQEKPKQETLEESVRIHLDKNKYSSPLTYAKIGAEWQAERMHSEKVELINWLKESLSAKLFYSTDADDLIDQFKKK